MASLGNLVVKLVLANVAGYKADLNAVAKDTQAAADKIDQANDKAGASTGNLGNKMGALRLVAGAAHGDLLGAAQGAQTLAGGAGVAAAGMGVLVAGLAAAAYAAHVGAQEQKAYDQALILTGNIAGTTASRMQMMARDIGTVVGTQYQAAAALTAMAATGRVAGNNLEKFSQVALEMERTVGASVGDTVKQFAELGHAPVQASLKLNETMNYLTASTFAQIKAAEELGQKELAASLAQNAFADAMKSRTAQIEGNLGTLERAWRTVRDAGKEAWDAMLGLGRQSGPSQMLEQAKNAVTNLEALLAKGGTATPDIQRKLDAARQNLDLQKEAVKLGERAGQIQADALATEKAKVGWIQEGDKYRSKEEKLELAIAKIRSEGAAAHATELEIEKRITFEREKGQKAGGRSAADPADAVLKNVYERIAASKLELEQDQKLTAGQQVAVRVLEDVRNGTLKLTQAKAALLGKGLEEMLQAEALIEARKESAKALADTLNAGQKMIEVGDKEVASLKKQLEAVQLKGAEIGKSKAQIDEILAQKNLLSAANDDEMAQNLLVAADYAGPLHDAYVQYALDLKEAARVKREIAAQESTNGVDQAKFDGVKKEGEELKRIWHSVDNTAQKAFEDIFSGGKNSFENLGKLLKTSLLDVLYQMTVKRWVFDITASVSGASGGAISAVAQGATGLNAANGLSSLSGLGTLGNGINYLTGGATTGVGTAFSSGFASAANGLTPLVATEVGTGAAVTGTTAAGLAEGAGAALGAVPVVGWIALAAVAAYAVFHKEQISSQSTASLYRTYDAGGSVTYENSPFAKGNGSAVVDNMYQTLAALQKGIGASGSAYLGYGSNTGKEGKTPNFAVTGNGYSTGEMPVTPGAVNLEIQRAIFTALQDSSMPKIIAKMFAGKDAGSLSGQEITAIESAAVQLTTGIKNLSSALNNMPFEQLRNMAFDTAAALVEASGGLQNLTANLTSYHDNFYSDAEKRTQKVSEITLALKNAGLSVSDNQIADMTREQYRAMVEGMGAVTEANAPMLAALYAVNGAFASINPIVTATAAATTTAAAAVQAISQNMVNLTAQSENLKVSLLRAQGNTSGADAAQRTIDTSGYTDAETAIYDYNKALQAQIDVLTAATAKAVQVAQERAGLQTQLNTLTDTTAQALARQRDALDASNQALFDQVQAIKAEQAAAAEAAKISAAAAAETGRIATERKSIQDQINALTDTATQALERQRNALDASNVGLFDYLVALKAEQAAIAAATAKAAQVAQEKLGLETQLLQLQGNTAELRKRELAVLDPANRSIKEFIYALEDVAKAAAAASAAANESARQFFLGVDKAKNQAALTDQAASGIDKFFSTIAATGSAQLTAATAANQAAVNASSAWKTAADSIRSSLDTIKAQTSVLSGTSYDSTRAQFNMLTSLARGGDAASAGKLGSAAQAFLTESQGQSRTMVDYLRDRSRVELSLTETLGNANAMKSAQDLIVDATQSTVDQLKAANVTLSGFSNEVYKLLSGNYAGTDRGTATDAAAKLASITADYQGYFASSKEGDVTQYDGGSSFKRLAGDMTQYTRADGSVEYLRASETALEIAKRLPDIAAVWQKSYGIILGATGKIPQPISNPAMPSDRNYILDTPSFVPAPSAVSPAAGGSSSTEIIAALDRLESRLRNIEGNTLAGATQGASTANALSGRTPVVVQIINKNGVLQ